MMFDDDVDDDDDDGADIDINNLDDEELERLFGEQLDEEENDEDDDEDAILELYQLAIAGIDLVILMAPHLPAEEKKNAVEGAQSALTQLREITDLEKVDLNERQAKLDASRVYTLYQM